VEWRDSADSVCDGDGVVCVVQTVCVVETVETVCVVETVKTVSVVKTGCVVERQ